MTSTLLTVRRQAAASSPDFRLLFESMPGPCLVLDSQLAIVAVTHAYTEAIFTRREDLLGRNIFDILQADPADAANEGVGHLRASLERVRRTARPDTMPPQKFGIRKPAEVGGGFVERHWRCANSPLAGTDGKLLYIIHRLEDASACGSLTGQARDQPAGAAGNPARHREVAELNARLKQENEDLLRSNQDLLNFAHMAAHDLQAPLRSIAGFTQLLHQECGDGLNGQAGEYMRYVLDNSRRLQALIGDILAYSRLETRRRPFKQVDLGRVLDDVITALALPVREGGVQMNCSNLPVVQGDRSQLASLFMNLIENGIKYRQGDSPRVEVRAERRGSEWLFAIQDNGIGIAPRHHGRIFEMFRRLHSSHAYPGSGIGLATCTRIVERHGGRIWVESREGEGSTFHFTLPAAADAARP